MESRLVLIVEDDEHIAGMLAAAIREADYEVVISATASAGLDIAVEIKPDCIVCDVDLPDEDGYWVARSIRTHPSPVSVTPFLFLSAYDDAQSRLQGFQVGADVYMVKPFRVNEVVAQVDALVHMAARMRQRRDSILSIAPAADYGSTAIEGDLRQMSIATVLSILGMERRTGVFEVVSKKRRAQIEITGGYVVYGTIGGTRVSALAAMRVMLSWKVGRFSFTPLPPCEPPPSLRTVQAILLDAAKAEDEAAAGTGPGLAADGRMTASIGGPPSRPDDTAPPSSRAMREGAGPISLAFDLIPSRRPDEMALSEVNAAIDPQIAAYERARSSAPERVRSSMPARAIPPATPRSPGVMLSNDDFVSVEVEEIDADGIENERTLLEEQTPKVPQVAELQRFLPTPPAGTALPNLRRTPAIAPPPGVAAASVKLPTPPSPPRPANVPRPSPSKSRLKKG